MRTYAFTTAIAISAAFAVQAPAPAAIHAESAANSFTAGRAYDRCTITGTRHNDVLRGTERRDVICGRGGDDVLIGRDGNDRLVGQKGNDQLRGGPGIDVLDGAAGWDVLRAGRGDDELVEGGAGHDRLYGGRGSETCLWAWNGGNNDSIRGGPGIDRYVADARDSVSSAKEKYDDNCGPIGTPLP
ncbi:MAG: calcium-binding protein [Candidatus Nanopelagicales bacterium]